MKLDESEERMVTRPSNVLVSKFAVACLPEHGTVRVHIGKLTSTYNQRKSHWTYGVITFRCRIRKTYLCIFDTEQPSNRRQSAISQDCGDRAHVVLSVDS